MRLSLGYPDEADEEAILDRFAAQQPPGAICSRWSTAEELLAAQAAVRDVEVDADVRRYIVAWCAPRATRPGARTRRQPARHAGPVPHRAGPGRHAGPRPWSLPDDVKAMAPYVLSHRLILNPAARLRNRDLDGLVPRPAGANARARRARRAPLRRPAAARDRKLPSLCVLRLLRPVGLAQSHPAAHRRRDRGAAAAPAAASPRRSLSACGRAPTRPWRHRSRPAPGPGGRAAARRAGAFAESAGGGAIRAVLR